MWDLNCIGRGRSVNVRIRGLGMCCGFVGLLVRDLGGGDGGGVYDV